MKNRAYKNNQKLNLNAQVLNFTIFKFHKNALVTGNVYILLCVSITSQK